MAIYDLKQNLQDYGHEFLILDFNHLFVAATLREEIWLIKGQNEETLLATLLREASEFSITAISGDRELESYSGGEKAILACLLVLAMIRSNDRYGAKVLLINILESLSEMNRSTMLHKFSDLHHRYRLRLFTRHTGQFEELSLPQQNTDDAAT